MSDDLREWLAKHCGKVDAYWKMQLDWNKNMLHWKDRVDIKISSLEKKVMWLTGFAAAIGAILGNLINRFLI